MALCHRNIVRSNKLCLWLLFLTRKEFTQDIQYIVLLYIVVFLSVHEPIQYYRNPNTSILNT